MATSQSTFAPDTYYARNRERILAERKARYAADHPADPDRVCVVCGVPFPGRSDRRVCSDLCRSRARDKDQKSSYWRDYYAKHGDKLRVNHRRRQAAKRVQPQPRPCAQCGVAFSPKRDRAVYCSRKCCYRAISVRSRDKENLRRRRKTAKRRASLSARDCRQCGQSFKPLRRSGAVYCSERCGISAWAKRHPEVAYAGRLRRRARLRGVETETIKPLVVFERDGWTCQLCGQPAPRRLLRTSSPHKPTVDHITPIAKGGTHTYANVQCACSRCNSRKAAKLLGQFRLF